MIEINLDQAIDELRAINRDISGQAFNKAIRLGLNDGIRKSRTLMVREVLNHFNETAFTPSGVRSALQTENATLNNLTARLGVSGKPLALAYFGARQTKTGVSVEIIKGQRKVVKSAFLVKSKGKGRKMPFARGEYNGNQFDFRKKRLNKTGPDLPISKLLSVSLPSAIHSEQVPVIPNVAQELEPYTMQRIEHYLTQMRLGNIK